MNAIDANVDDDRTVDVPPVEKELYVAPRLIVLDVRDTEAGPRPANFDGAMFYS